jgi:hypothetical protein
MKYLLLVGVIWLWLLELLLGYAAIRGLLYSVSYTFGGVVLLLSGNWDAAGEDQLVLGAFVVLAVVVGALLCLAIWALRATIGEIFSRKQPR